MKVSNKTCYISWAGISGFLITAWVISAKDIVSIKEIFILVSIMLFCAGMVFWALLSLSNPKNVRGIIYWRSGDIQKTGYFDRYSEFEEWKESYLKENGHNIKLIDYELENRENEE